MPDEKLSVFKVQISGTIQFTGTAYLRAALDDDGASLREKMDRLRAELLNGVEIVAQRDLSPFVLQNVVHVSELEKPIRVHDSKGHAAADVFPNYVLED